jgi:hypothetical protein
MPSAPYDLSSAARADALANPTAREFLRARIRSSRG